MAKRLIPATGVTGAQAQPQVALEPTPPSAPEGYGGASPSPAAGFPVDARTVPLGEGYWDKFLLQSQDALESGPVGIPGVAPGYLSREVWENSLSFSDYLFDQPKLSVGELNKRYPDIPQPFSEATSPSVAQYRYNNFKRRQAREEKIAYGLEQFGTGSKFAAGFASILDPAAIALMVATGGGSTAAQGLKGVGTVFLNNLEIMAALELPGHLAKEREQLKPELKDMLTNIVAGSTLGTAIHYALPAVVKGAKIGAEKTVEASSTVYDKSSEWLTKLQRTVVQQAEEGRKISPDVANHAAPETVIDPLGRNDRVPPPEEAPGNPAPQGEDPAALAAIQRAEKPSYAGDIVKDAETQQTLVDRELADIQADLDHPDMVKEIEGFNDQLKDQTAVTKAAQGLKDCITGSLL